jgi:GntR family transcriptional repressor for pyruvate dehydrogenase complex
MRVVPVAQRSAAENVRTQLLDLIQSGEIKIDQRLPSEAELAQSFAVSRSVIREALHSLNALGLTRSYAGKGTFVAATEVPSQLLMGRYLPSHLNEVRQALEVPAARLAAERHQPTDLLTLRDLLDAFGTTKDAERRVKVDADFHLAIAAASGNPLFPRLVADLRAVLQEQALAVSVVAGRAAQAHAEHCAIFDAITAGDGQGAAAAMDQHLRAVVALTSGNPGRPRRGSSDSNTGGRAAPEEPAPKRAQRHGLDTSHEPVGRVAGQPDN